MTTLKWSIKLLGNLTDRDFVIWKAAAKIPECYVFEITSSADGWGEYPGMKEATIPIPDEGNTLLIVGKDHYNLFEPYCFPDHKCVINADVNDFKTGTLILSTIMTSDGLLDKSVIEAITGKVDMASWIKKYYPAASPCFDDMDACIDPATGCLNDTDNAVKLSNAICKYVLSSLGVCKTALGKEELPTTVSPQEKSEGIPMMYYVMGAGAAILAGAGYYIWKSTR